VKGCNGRLVYSGVSVLYGDKTKSLLILPDKYDFDCQKYRSFFRNAATSIGGSVASKNGKFPIMPLNVYF
jgi:hypothetical protein